MHADIADNDFGGVKRSWSFEALSRCSQDGSLAGGRHPSPRGGFAGTSPRSSACICGYIRKGGKA